MGPKFMNGQRVRIKRVTGKDAHVAAIDSGVKTDWVSITRYAGEMGNIVMHVAAPRSAPKQSFTGIDIEQATVSYSYNVDIGQGRELQNVREEWLEGPY